MRTMAVVEGYCVMNMSLSDIQDVWIHINIAQLVSIAPYIGAEAYLAIHFVVLT